MWHNEIYSSKSYPTVAIHGACATGRIWESIALRFAEVSKPFYAVTLPGHQGPIDSRFGKYTLSVYASAVSRFIREQIGGCHILGHSMGGLVAQLIDPSVESKVVRRVLIGAPPAGKPLISPALGLRAVKYLPAIIFGWPWKYTYKDYRELLCNELSDSLAGTLYVESVEESGTVARQMLLGSTRPQEIPGEIHVLCSRYDQIVPMQLQRKMLRMQQYPKVQTLSFAGGHMSLFEPGNTIVDEILVRLYPPRG